MELRGEHVLLRPLAAADAPLLAGIARQPGFARWWPDLGEDELRQMADGAGSVVAFAKVGFRAVGILREYERSSDGTWHDGLLMDLVARELT